MNHVTCHMTTKAANQLMTTAIYSMVMGNQATVSLDIPWRTEWYIPRYIDLWSTSQKQFALKSHFPWQTTTETVEIQALLYNIYYIIDKYRI